MTAWHNLFSISLCDGKIYIETLYSDEVQKVYDSFKKKKPIFDVIQCQSVLKLILFDIIKYHVICVWGFACIIFGLYLHHDTWMIF